jgi:hypothetical protein
MEWVLRLMIDGSGLIPGVSQVTSGAKVALDTYQAIQALRVFLASEEGKELEAKISKVITGVMDMKNGKPVLVLRTREEVINALESGKF